jgi:rhamnogalacturonyl hydrolase YesR
MRHPGPALLFALFSVFAVLPAADAADPLRVQREGRRLELEATLPPGISEVELRIASSRNRPVPKHSDVSLLAPKSAAPKATAQKASARNETWFPVVDLEITPTMEGVARFDSPAGFYAVNGWIYPEKFLVEPEVVIPGRKLERWENALWLEPARSALKEFYLRQRLPVQAGALRHTLRLLSEDWSGVLALHAVTATGSGPELMKIEVAPVPLPAKPISGVGQGLQRGRLLNSLAATVGFTVRAHHRNPASPFDGGLYEFYDLDARTYRSVHWIWGYGPSVKLLLDAAKIPAVAARFAPGELVKIAHAIGLMTLRWSERNVIDMLVTSRWERRPELPYGFSEALTPADGLFTMGLAWIPLYEVTGDERYLTAAKRLAASVERLCQGADIVPQNYWPATRTWSDFTIDESGFGTEGLAELYRVTQDVRYREQGQKYMGQIVAKLERPDGLWDRSYVKSTGKSLPTQRMTRGMGWAMEGLLAMHRLDPEGDWLARAKKMGDSLLASQLPDGSWSFNFDQPANVAGVSEKGTALWSLLFYRTHTAGGETRHREAARKALEWCLNHQYTGLDIEAQGSLVGMSPHSAVGYRPWFRVSCTYASGFFGLAALEELQIQERQRSN